MNLIFFIASILLGVGLAMDAFSVSMANGMNEKKMAISRMIQIAIVFAGFQFLMPMIGWFAVHTVSSAFTIFMDVVPWIALILLLYIGGGMIKDGFEEEEEDEAEYEASTRKLMIQGIATSIDALSVGFTIADYTLSSALITSVIIAVVTFIICYVGVVLGKKFGMVFANKSSILGGVILILIGIEIFVTGIGLLQNNLFILDQGIY